MRTLSTAMLLRANRYDHLLARVPDVRGELGVARVLIGDLVSEGYLRVHTTLGDTDSVDDRRELIGRTLRGLRGL